MGGGAAATLSQTMSEMPVARSSVSTKELLPIVYAELRRIAARKMSCEPPGHTLQATALVHEAWLELGGRTEQEWHNRRHFFSAAAEAMRRILVQSARRKRALRRGGGLEHCALEDVEIACAMPGDELLAIHEALDALVAEDPVKAELVKLRYFAGLTIEEAAAVLEISPRTARRQWAFARAYLYDAVLKSRE